MILISMLSCQPVVAFAAVLYLIAFAIGASCRTELDKILPTGVKLEGGYSLALAVIAYVALAVHSVYQPPC